MTNPAALRRVPGLGPRGRIAAALVTAGVLASSCGAALPAAQTGSTVVSTPSPTTAPASTAPATTAPATTAPATTAPPTTVPTMSDEVVGALAGFTGWDVPTRHSVDDRALSADSWQQTADGKTLDYSCSPEQLAFVEDSFTEFPAFGFSGTLVPGLVVEGSSVERADLRVIGLDRAPMTLVSSLAQETPTMLVENPTTGEISTAVAELKRNADARVTGLDVVPADVDYMREETHSFQQSRLQVGVSARYSGRMTEVGFEGGFEQVRGEERHSIVVRLYQPMYTISMQRDGLTRPADYFAPTVTLDDVNAAQSSGSLADGNPPIVVDGVTYGRAVYMVITSSEVSDSSELFAIVDASRGSLSGEGTITSEQQQVLSRSDVHVYALGGSQSSAQAAIQSGDLSQFFGSANAANAAALTFTMRTLDGEQVAVADTAELNRLACNSSQRFYDLTIDLEDIRGTMIVRVDGEKVLTVEGTKRNRGSGSVTLRAGGSVLDDPTRDYEVNFEYDFNGCHTPSFVSKMRSSSGASDTWSDSEGYGCADEEGTFEFNPQTGAIREIDSTLD